MVDKDENATTVDFGYPTGAHGRIPSFNSVEEEAEFWETHDFTDFAEESTPVEVTIGDELAERLTVRLDQGDRQELALRAKRLGVGPSTLARIVDQGTPAARARGARTLASVAQAVKHLVLTPAAGSSVRWNYPAARVINSQ